MAGTQPRRLLEGQYNRDVLLPTESSPESTMPFQLRGQSPAIGKGPEGGKPCNSSANEPMLIKYSGEWPLVRLELRQRPRIPSREGSCQNEGLGLAK